MNMPLSIDAWYATVPTGQIAGTPPALIMKIYARTKQENVLEREGRAIVIL